MIIDKIKSRTIQDLLKVLSGNIVAQGLGFLTIVLISRDLGPSQYGIFSLLLAIFTVSVQISDFGISTSYVKYTSEHLQKRREIFTTVLLAKLLLAVFVVIFLSAASGRISNFFLKATDMAASYPW